MLPAISSMNARRCIATLMSVASLALAVATPVAPAFGEDRSNFERYDGGVLLRRISMGSGKSIIVELPRDAAEVVIGNPKVADAIVRSARKLYIMGGEAGQTTIFAMDQAGRQVANIEVSIGRDVGELGPLLKAALPKSNIVARTVNDTIILTGTVSSSGEAQRAIDIAKGFAAKANQNRASESTGPGGSGDGNVINAMTIHGDEQVMLKVTVAEIERKIIKQLGFSAQAGGNTLLNGSWGSLAQENPFGINSAMSASALTLKGYNNTSLTLKAFERYGVSRLLAEPSVTAVSGESAKMLVGGEIAVPGSGSCTIFSGGAQPVCSPGITFKSYGVSLAFTPVVIAEGRILLHLSTEVTEIDLQNSFQYANVAVPGFKTRKNETTIELPSGGSIASAGLLSQKSARAINGLPGLLNLPVLGALFRSNDYQRDETELLIVVTPYIVKPISAHEVTRPDENFADASDPQNWLLGRVNRIYSTKSNPQMMQNFKGRVGFIHD